MQVHWGRGGAYPRREFVPMVTRETSWRQCYFVAPSKFNLHTHVTKKSSRQVQQLDRAGWVGQFESKLTTATERGVHKVVTDAVHVVRIPTSPPASTNGIEPGRIILPILHADYAYVLLTRGLG